jgi:hypothetical protein
MKIRFLILFFALLMALPVACTAEKIADKSQFHPPQTAAEKALDHILTLDKNDDDLSAFIFNLPKRNKSKDKEFSSLFTQPLMDAWEKAYLGIPEEPEGGRYIDIGFITCAQDVPDYYLYSTVKDDGHEALLHAVWSVDAERKRKMSSLPPPRRMIKENGVWKLDGVKCPGKFVFNTDFHYTK